MGRAAGSAASSFIVLVGLTLFLGLAGYVGYNYIQTPLVTDVSPNPARPAETVTLKGDRFSTEIGGNIVLFGDKVGKVQRATPNLLEVQVPEVGVLLGEQVRLPVRVLSRGRVSEAVDLSIQVTPVVGRSEEPARASPPPPPAATPRPPAPESPAGPPPSDSPASVEAAPVAAASSPSRRPRSSASAAPAPPPRIDEGWLLGEADGALAQNRFDAAASLYDKILEADPGNARAKAGKAAAQAAASSWKRGFSSGKTQAEGRGARDKLKEFEGVSMKKPAEIPALVEFEAQPAHVKAGDPYSVKVYLKNTGTKPIRIASMTLTTTVNGSASGGAAPPLAKEVPPGERAWIQQAAANWKDGVTSWSLEVQLVSGRGDTYRNQLIWK